MPDMETNDLPTLISDLDYERLRRITAACDELLAMHDRYGDVIGEERFLRHALMRLCGIMVSNSGRLSNELRAKFPQLPQDWVVNGNKREGTKMVKNQSKLMLRAFNGELDAAVAKVNWNNVDKMLERVQKAFDAINQSGSVTQIAITNEYLKHSLAEIRLTYELERKKQEIKEEQRRIREQMRDEEQAQREFEKAQKTAEAEEARYQKALVAARAEMEKAKASEMAKVQEKVAQLEAKLLEAQNNVQRAVSMAQLTRSGHVYVISNIGSFGDEVFKIGMTRRLEPTERVYELGDASVPFPYDIHAMIYSLDAPALENAFHREFADRRVNAINTRKEFFRVTLSEIRIFALQHDASIEFTELAEAREYRQTLSLRQRSAEQTLPVEEELFPESILVASRSQ